MDSNKNLKKALENLREYHAPDSVWDKINRELEQKNAEIPLKEALKQLPVYEPSDKVWKQLATNLPRRKSFMQVYRTQLAVAASFAVLLGVAVWFFNNSNAPTYKYAYSEEVLDERIQLEQIEGDADAFAMIDAICNEREFLCKHVDFQQLKGELQDLNSAYEELAFALGEINTSTELMDEMTNIEMERTAVFKQLLAML